MFVIVIEVSFPLITSKFLFF